MTAPAQRCAFVYPDGEPCHFARTFHGEGTLTHPWSPAPAETKPCACGHDEGTHAKLTNHSWPGLCAECRCIKFTPAPARETGGVGVLAVYGDDEGRAATDFPAEAPAPARETERKCPNPDGPCGCLEAHEPAETPAVRVTEEGEDCKHTGSILREVLCRECWSFLDPEEEPHYRALRATNASLLAALRTLETKLREHPPELRCSQCEAIAADAIWKAEA